MAENIKRHITHIKSKVANQKPTSSQLLEGEVAVNYAKDKEFLSIKNESGDVVTFSSDNYYTEQKLGSGFTGSNSGNTVTKVIEDNEKVISSALNALNEEISNLDETYVSLDTNQTISGKKTFSETVNIEDDMNVTGTARFNGDAKIFGHLYTSDMDVDGKAIFDDNVDIHGNGYISGSLTVNGTTNLEGKTYITGSLDMCGNDIENVQSITINGTTRTKDNLETHNIKPMTGDTYNIGTKSSDPTKNKYYKTIYVRNVNDIPVSGFAQTDTLAFKKITNPSDSSKVGIVNTLSQNYDTNIGNGAVIEGEGTSTTKITASGEYSHAEGYMTTASNYASHAEGQNTTASTWGSHAEGSSTRASGSNSHAEGYSTTASGYASHAEGYTVKASGDYSHAEGWNTTASGSDSHAEGRDTTANGNSSHAEGSGTTASGIYSHAEGQSTIASSSYSHAEGQNTTASGGWSHAEGNNTTASGYASHAEGITTKASGNYSHAEGSGTTASGDYSHAEGVNTIASGDYSHAEGYSTTASGSCSHAEGQSTTASTSYSHAEGYLTKAINNSSHAEGYSTTASGYYSHAEGYSTTASGSCSHAEGQSTKANGQNSHAEGYSTTASGTYSHAEGDNTITNNTAEHASGQYNVSSSASTTFGNSGNTLFSVGNGTTNNARHNAFEIRQNGDIYIVKDNTNVKLQDVISQCIYVTYSELKTLKQQNKLREGTKYRITDFVTTTTQANTQSANHPFDIIVTATSSNTLSETAMAAKRNNDTYFSGSNLSAWDIKYCFENDTNRFGWADSINGKGIIYYMKDEFSNEAPYDFKNIQFKRWKCTSVSATTSGVPTSLVSSMQSIFVNHYHLYTSSSFTVNSIKVTPNTSDSKFFYTFSLCGNGTEDDSKAVIDGSLKDYGEYMYRNNVIREYYMLDGDDTVYMLNNIVFKPTEDGVYDACVCNVFGKNCRDMTFGFSLANLNSFGNDCYNNTFGYNCYYNTFGISCYGNFFGNNCNSNSFGNSCYNNAFGYNCSTNSFGNGCSNNSFGRFCKSNSFGNSCRFIYLEGGNNGMSNVNVESGNQYITLNASGGTNITIAKGVNGSTTRKTINHTNITGKTTYQNSNSTVINV